MNSPLSSLYPSLVRVSRIYTPGSCRTTLSTSRSLNPIYSDLYAAAHAWPSTSFKEVARWLVRINSWIKALEGLVSSFFNISCDLPIASLLKLQLVDGPLMYQYAGECVFLRVNLKNNHITYLVIMDLTTLTVISKMEIVVNNPFDIRR